MFTINPFALTESQTCITFIIKMLKYLLLSNNTMKYFMCSLCRNLQTEKSSQHFSMALLNHLVSNNPVKEKIIGGVPTWVLYMFLGS